MCPKQDLVIGLGSGRCGTSSLEKLLNSQPNSDVSHEISPQLPWEPDYTQAQKRIEGILSRSSKLIGDVAFYYLNYIDWIIRKWPTARFICLQRDRVETIRSYLAWVKFRGNLNHWIDHKGKGWNLDPEYDPSYPKFNETDLRKAIGCYWDQYYGKAKELSCRYPEHFLLLEMRYALNTLQGINSVLDFLDVDREYRCIRVGIKINAHLS